MLGEERIAPVVRALNRVRFGEEPTLHQLPVHVYAPVFGATFSLLFDFYSVAHTRIILGFLSSEDFVCYSRFGLLISLYEVIVRMFALSNPVLSRLPVEEHPHKLIPCGVGRYIFENDAYGGVAHTLIILGFLEVFEQRKAPRVG